MAKLNENFKLWSPKLEPPMSDRDTLNYLIKYYNLKRLRDWKKERWENSDKNNAIIENLQSIRHKLDILDLAKNNIYELTHVIESTDYINYRIKCSNSGIPEKYQLNEEDYNTLKEWLK